MRPTDLQKDAHNVMEWNQNIFASVDIETTGLVAGFHEIVQIAVQPLDANLEPMSDVRPFYTTISPDHPERADHNAMHVHGLTMDELQESSLDKWRVAEMFEEWFIKLNLPMRRRLIMLAHNVVFENAFIKAWLGIESYDQFFHPHPRDSMMLATAINDRAILRGEKVVYNRLNLPYLCKELGIVFEDHHDSLADALACAKVYKALLHKAII